MLPIWIWIPLVYLFVKPTTLLNTTYVMNEFVTTVTITQSNSSVFFLTLMQ